MPTSGNVLVTPVFSCKFCSLIKMLLERLCLNLDLFAVHEDVAGSFHIVQTSFGRIPRVFLYWAVIGVRQMACLCKLDTCDLLFIQLGSFSTLSVINQLRRLNLRVQSSIWLQLFSLGSPPTLDGLRSLLALLVQHNLGCFRCGTPPQRIDFSPFSCSPRQRLQSNKY